MRTEDWTPDIPDEFLTEIGRVTTRWAILESMLDLCLMKLAGKELTDPRSLIIFNHMAYPMKLDILAALISELLPNYPGLAGFPAIHQSLKQAQEKRNLVAHSKFGVNAESGDVEISRVNARGKLKTSITPITLAEIKSASELVANAAQNLWDLVVAAGTASITPQAGQ